MTRLPNHFAKLIAISAAIAVLAAPAGAAALTGISPSTSSTTLNTAQQQRLATIISKGDQEITRRLAQLNKLSVEISSATHLTATDKTTLATEVNNEITGLKALKAKLDAETTMEGAITDAKSIISDYRVYALITPKVWLIRAADAQQTAEAKLTALITKFQTRINAAKSQGKEVTALQNALNNMTTQVKNSQAISSSIEAKVLPLQPSDYNSDHVILSGDAAQLKTAHADNEASYADAKTIVADLKSL